jgi:hypothetical protein
MTDLAPLVNQLLIDKHSAPAIAESHSDHPTTETVNEFLKEAYRIVSTVMSRLTL